jgi:hypothetical protein
MPWLFPIIDRVPLWVVYALAAAGGVCVTVGAVVIGYVLKGVWLARFEWRERRYRSVRREIKRPADVRAAVARRYR